MWNITGMIKSRKLDERSIQHTQEGRYRYTEFWQETQIKNLHGAPRYRREGIETDAKIMG
jgi:hypothetical protein